MKVTGTKEELERMKNAFLWWNGCIFGVNKQCIKDDYGELDCLKCIELHVEWEEIE